MKRKIIVAVLCSALVMGIVSGCGKSSDNSVSASDSKAAASEEIKYDALDYVTLGKYKGVKITLSKSDYEVTEDDVKTEVESQIANYPSYKKTKETEVKKDSVVNIDFVGTMDGEEFSGGSAEDTYIDIEEDENSYIDGFVSEIVGHKVGETFDENLTFPDDYSATDLAGKDVTFSITVNYIAKKENMTYDTLTDEYVSENFQSDSVEAYIESVKESLEETADSNKESDIKSLVTDKVINNATILSLPEGLLEKRLSDYKSQFEQMCEEQDLTLEEYLSNYYGMTEDEFDEQIEEYMTEYVNKEVVFAAVAEAEKLEINDDEFEEYVDEIVTSNGFDDESALFEEYGEEYVKSVYLNDKVVTPFLVDSAKITYSNKKTDTTESSDTESSNEESE